jgi:hypothetical protein
MSNQTEAAVRSLPYGFTQSAKAGPGLLVQDAVSTSPFLEIAMFPFGHVTEANFSPASQTRSHFLSVLHVTARRPREPAGPGGPA